MSLSADAELGCLRQLSFRGRDVLAQVMSTKINIWLLPPLLFLQTSERNKRKFTIVRHHRRPEMTGKFLTFAQEVVGVVHRFHYRTRDCMRGGYW